MIYQFKCIPCGIAFDYDKNEGAKCPGCRKKATRVFALAGIQFKGSGWGSHKKKFE